MDGDGRKHIDVVHDRDSGSFCYHVYSGKNPETKAAVKRREDSLIIAAIMSIVLSLVTMNIFIIYDELDFLMQISEYTKLVISVLFFEYLIADPKPGKLFCRHRWRRTGFEEKLEHGISYSMRTYECMKMR